MRASFGARVLKARLLNHERYCPYCFGRQLGFLGRKKLLLDVLTCDRCRLIFRYPVDTEEVRDKFYEVEYKEGLTTSVPSPRELEEMMAAGFSDSPLDLRPKLDFLQVLKPSGRVLDFGASWGYGVYQLRMLGYEAVGFELSRRRCSLGQELLGVPLVSTWDGLGPDFDVIWTNHVVEHIGIGLRELFGRLARLLKPDGVMLHILPNFTGMTARAGAFWSWIGEAHPLAPTQAFFEHVLPEVGLTVEWGTGPFDSELVESARVGDWARTQRDGDELFVVARPG